MGKQSEEDGAAKPQADVGYAKSRNGVFQIIEMVVGLVAFICVESVAECRGMFNCAPPGYVHSYRFFAFVSFASILFTGATFAARMLGVSGRVPIPAKYHPFAVSSPRGILWTSLPSSSCSQEPVSTTCHVLW